MSQKWKYKPKGLFREVYAEMIFSAESLRINARAIFFALGVGMVVGVIGGFFSRLLSLSDQFREEVFWSIFLLPLVGLIIVWLYRKGGIKTAGGTDIVIQAARGEQPVSRLLAPVIFLATILTHFFGGSAGREGAALQLGGSLAEVLRKLFKLGDEFEDLAVMCGMSAGFSAVFGNQISAVIFALEISCVGMLPMGALLPCVVSSLLAGEVAQLLGCHAVVFTLNSSPEDFLFFTRVLILAVACGLLSILVCYAFSGVRQGFERFFPDPYLRVVVGGCIVVGLTLLLNTRHYLGSGQALIDQSIGQGQALPWDFALKLLLTAITLGAGFKGGEIVPAFAIGASFGCVMGPLLGLDPAYAAAIGMVAVFCGVTNCPLTSLVLGFEVFAFCNPGGFLAAVAASFLVSGYSGLYSKQKFAFSKVADSTGTVAEEENIHHRL
ncbi:MAG: chloride channel protein [Ruminiclostridium sp.]|nr:chloride channel protein [Ruminiclostridium sp.]